MKILPMRLRAQVLAFFLGLSLGAPMALHAATDDVVLVWGETSDQGMMNFQGFGGQTLSKTPAEACSELEEFLNLNAGGLAGMLMAGAEAFDDVAAAAAAAARELHALCSPEQSGPSEMWVIYTTCSMLMGDGLHIMRWTVPPGADEAEMIVLDMSTGEGVYVPLETRLDQLGDAGVPAGNLRAFDISGPSQERNQTVRVDGVERQYTAHRYEYSYEGDIAALGVPELAVLGQIGKITSTGHAWIAPDAPGVDVISAFYENFRNNVLPAAGMGSLMAGALNQMAGLASRGIPLETSQEVTVGMGVMSIGAGAGFGAGSTSTSKIDAISIVPGRASIYCGPTVVPEGFTVTNINDIMPNTMSGPAGGGPGGAGPGEAEPGTEEMAATMDEFNAAMANMSEEERAAMQQFAGGFGQLLGGVLSGEALPGAAPGGAPPPPPSAPARTGPSAADLASDDLTQMVQNYLQALGYDPGNTDGEISTETVIAISQFQAEKGLEVTGAVTPQLAGILAAEIDR
jgi:hypothetical protein